MRGSKRDTADDATRAQRYLDELIVLRFCCGESMAEIATRYELEGWVVEATIREHMAGQRRSA